MQSLFGNLGLDAILGILSAAVALASFILNLRLIARQERRNAANLKLAYDSDIIKWSTEVIEALAMANETLCEKGLSYTDQDFASRRSAERAKLSALIDRGRIFFPNREDGDYGKDKELGFQGRRQAILDALVDAHELLGKAGGPPGPDRASADALLKHRRMFIAEVYKAIDPVRRGVTLKELSA